MSVVHHDGFGVCELQCLSLQSDFTLRATLCGERAQFPNVTPNSAAVSCKLCVALIDDVISAGGVRGLYGVNFEPFFAVLWKRFPNEVFVEESGSESVAVFVADALQRLIDGRGKSR